MYRLLLCFHHVFDNSMSKEAKVKRLKAVLNTFSRNRVTFYMNKEMLANLKEFDLPVQLSLLTQS